MSPLAVNISVEKGHKGLYKPACLYDRLCQPSPVLPFLPSPISSMSSVVPEPSSSAGDPSRFQLAGSEKLRKPRWKLESLPDLTGKVVMVTNPNNKVGKDTAKVLNLLSVFGWSR